MLMKRQHLRFIRCKNAGHSRVSNKLALKTEVLASMHLFAWECLDLQVSEQQNPHTFATACF